MRLVLKPRPLTKKDRRTPDPQQIIHDLGGGGQFRKGPLPGLVRPESCKMLRPGL